MWPFCHNRMPADRAKHGRKHNIIRKTQIWIIHGSIHSFIHACCAYVMLVSPCACTHTLRIVHRCCSQQPAATAVVVVAAWIHTHLYEIGSFLFKHKLNYIMTYNIDTFDEEYLHWIDTGFVLHRNNTDSCMFT